MYIFFSLSNFLQLYSRIQKSDTTFSNGYMTPLYVQIYLYFYVLKHILGLKKY